MRFPNFHNAIQSAETLLMHKGVEVNPGRWQGISTEGRPDLGTIEVLNYTAVVPVYRGPFHNPRTLEGSLEYQLSKLQSEIEPNLPWADDHFVERVSRVPSNPGEEYKNWPWWSGSGTQVETALNATGVKFTHTYQERFWPKVAHWHIGGQPQGIHYDYGDLDDVVNHLVAEPFSRQATFPIFFPEDTGAVHGGRIPCTLHYHFLLRNQELHMWYAIRSCDFVRHFRDDLYLACRLLIWVLDECRSRESFWENVRPGNLYFTAYSLHIHKGDIHHVKTLRA
jgi:hypothetical protein